MATLNRMRIPWSGTAAVGGGLTTFYFSGAMTGVPAAVLTFFNAIKGLVPPGVTWTVPTDGDTLEDSTNELTGTWTASGGGVVTGTGTGSYMAGCGCRIVWNTANVHLGRRVRGSTFLVPLWNGVADTDGTLTTSSIAILQPAATALVTATTPNFRIYSRPNSVGSFAVSSVTSATIPDKISTLRSRRV